MATAQATWPPIPAWQITQLQNLSDQGQLSGVPPQILAIISQVESGGEVNGAGVNSAGYGGYFGLGTGQYPGGSVTNAQLETNSPDSFDTQARVAASAFAAYLQQAGGNPVQAEQIYQTGSADGPPSDGATIMSQYFGGSSIQLTSASTSGTSSSGCKPVLKVPVVGTVFNSCQAQEIVGALLMISGGLILFVGLALVAASMGTGRGLPTPARITTQQLGARNTRTTRVAVERERGEQRRQAAEERDQRRRANAPSRRRTVNAKDLSRPPVEDPNNPGNPF